MPQSRLYLATLAIALSSAPALTQPEYNPQRALWTGIKSKLAAADGEEYFNSNLKGTAVPPLTGTLISALMNEGVSRLILGLTEAATPEVTLILHNGKRKAKAKPKPGTPIEFQGVAIDFTRSPFMLTFDVEAEGIQGLEWETKK